MRIIVQKLTIIIILFRFHTVRLTRSCRTVARGTISHWDIACDLWYIFLKPLCFRIVHLDINDLRWPASQIQIGRMERSYVTKQSLIKPFFSIFGLPFFIIMRKYHSNKAGESHRIAALLHLPCFTLTTSWPLERKRFPNVDSSLKRFIYRTGFYFCGNVCWWDSI